MVSHDVFGKIREKAEEEVVMQHMKEIEQAAHARYIKEAKKSISDAIVLMIIIFLCVEMLWFVKIIFEVNAFEDSEDEA